MSRVLVTGAAGVIGRALLPALRAAGFVPVAFDRALDPRQELTTAASDVAAGCVGVVHLAACARVGRCEADPAGAWSDNVVATEALLGALGGAWIVFASSREVIGRPETLPAGDGTPCRPVNVYGQTKRAAEERVLATARERAAVLRLANVYGAEGDHADRLVPAWLAAALSGAPLVVNGAARSVDLVHVDDVVRGIVAAAVRLDAGHPTPPTLLCSGHEQRLGALAAAVRAVTGSTSPVIEGDAAPYEVDRFRGDPAPAWARLGWRAQVPLAEGLARLLPPSLPALVSA